MTLLRRGADVQRPPLRLIPVWAALAGTFVVAISVAAAVLYTGLQLLDTRGLKSERQLTSKTLFDLVKLAFGVVAGAGGLVALVVAYRRQRVDEAAALREATKLHTDRFTAALEQVGSDSPAVQLGGMHALAGLADDAPTRQLRQTCIDVMCAYLRLPYDPDPGDDLADAEQRKKYRAVREVRHTVIRIIGNHLREGAAVSWRGHDFDFTGVVFDGGDLHGAVFSSGTALFRGAEFVSGKVDFTDARFSGGEVEFTEARFSGGEVELTHAEFSGGRVEFYDATFSGSMVSFTGTTFSGSEVSFVRAQFSGGEVQFRGANFVSGKVSFDASTLSGSTVEFWDASFSGSGVGFHGATFSGGALRVSGATFTGGEVDFSHALGAPPQGVVSPDGKPLLEGIKLPPDWRMPRGTRR